jgi:hypothetical protein
VAVAMLSMSATVSGGNKGGNKLYSVFLYRYNYSSSVNRIRLKDYTDSGIGQVLLKKIYIYGSVGRLYFNPRRRSGMRRALSAGTLKCSRYRLR